MFRETVEEMLRQEYKEKPQLLAAHYLSKYVPGRFAPDFNAATYHDEIVNGSQRPAQTASASVPQQAPAPKA